MKMDLRKECIGHGIGLGVLVLNMDPSPSPSILLGVRVGMTLL